MEHIQNVDPSLNKLSCSFFYFFNDFHKINTTMNRIENHIPVFFVHFLDGHSLLSSNTYVKKNRVTSHDNDNQPGPKLGNNNI